MFVYTALVHYGILLEKGGEIGIELGMFPFIMSKPPLFLINAVHRLTPFVIVDFPFECYTGLEQGIVCEYIFLIFRTLRCCCWGC